MVEQGHQTCVRNNDRQQEYQPGEDARDDESYVQQLMAHDGHRHGNRDKRDGEQHFDGRAGDQTPGQDHDQRYQHCQQ